MDHIERLVVSPLPVDLGATLGIHRRGPGDPAMRFSRDGSAWRATRTPEGPATLRLSPVSCPGAAGESGAGNGSGPGATSSSDATSASGRTSVPGRPTVVRVQAWGPGAAWAIDQAPELVGATEDPAAVADFADLVTRAGSPFLAAAWARFAGARLGRTRRVLEALVPAIIEQKVTGDEARTAYVALVRRHGEPAPGPWDAQRRPAPLRVPPAPEALASLPGYAYHPLGLERRRADAIRGAAARATRLEECAALPLARAYARLQALPLVGPWTAAEVALRALGDPDAVSVGDFHLAHAVGWALAGEERATDERMLALLAPYAGHRARLVRLIELAGVRAPRRGPRLAPRSIAGI